MVFDLAILTLNEVIKHRGEAMYISLIDFSWYCAKRNDFKLFNHSLLDYNYMHQLWNYVYYISTKID